MALNKSSRDKISSKIQSQIQQRRWPSSKAILAVKIRDKHQSSFSNSVKLMILCNMGTKIPFLLLSCVLPHGAKSTGEKKKKKNKSAGSTLTASKTDFTVAKKCPQMCCAGSLAGEVGKGKPIGTA